MKAHMGSCRFTGFEDWGGCLSVSKGLGMVSWEKPD
jgi:hypothetical protein